MQGELECLRGRLVPPADELVSNRKGSSLVGSDLFHQRPCRASGEKELTSSMLKACLAKVVVVCLTIVLATACESSGSTV
jgi:hypothetical protein